jgi:hypothetical protein
MVAGEPIKSMGPSKEYDQGHEKTFGEARPDFPRGRRFRWDPELKRLVPAGMVQEKLALVAPINSGRLYENTAATDGTDIGSRAKHREYMKRHNLTTADDFKGTWARQEKERERIRKEGVLPDRTRRDDVGRALHKHRPE